jgi:hypothetical protein
MGNRGNLLLSTELSEIIVDLEMPGCVNLPSDHYIDSYDE